MYIVAVFLFLTPIVLIVVGWNRALRHSDPSQSNWRTTCRTTSLLVASIAVAIGLAAMIAWLHVGGNPHGMGTPPGVWRILDRVFWWTLLSSIVLAIVGKGRGRFFVFGAAVAAVLAGFAVIVLNMD
jgi:hypothetical protein